MFAALGDMAAPLNTVYREHAQMKALIERFFEQYPDIEQNEHLSGADMIQFVTLWMHDAALARDFGQPTSFL